jgi:hypothetical protein
MTEEERQRISELLLERMLKEAIRYAPLGTEYIERYKNFIATKTDEYLLTRLINPNTRRY